MGYLSKERNDLKCGIYSITYFTLLRKNWAFTSLGENNSFFFSFPVIMIGQVKYKSETIKFFSNNH